MEGKIVLGGTKPMDACANSHNLHVYGTQLTCIWLVGVGIIQEGASFPPPKETLQLYIKLPLVLFIVTLM